MYNMPSNLDISGSPFGDSSLEPFSIDENYYSTGEGSSFARFPADSSPVVPSRVIGSWILRESGGDSSIFIFSQEGTLAAFEKQTYWTDREEAVVSTGKVFDDGNNLLLGFERNLCHYPYTVSGDTLILMQTYTSTIEGVTSLESRPLNYLKY
jgi:hypothetical protein